LHTLSFYSHLSRAPLSTLFPYTTLFRSRNFRKKLCCSWRDFHAPSCRTVRPITCSAGSPTSCNRASLTFRKTPSREVMPQAIGRSEEHTSELQSLRHLVCRLLLEKKKKK